MNLEKSISENKKDLLHSDTILTEPQFKQLAHLPLLTVFYLFFQRQFSSTPVTALELAAYLGMDVKIAEGVLSFLHQQGIVRAFKDDLAAYSLGKELDQISVKDLVTLVAEFHELIKKAGEEIKPLEVLESNEKYRKLYSELASEILKLFGQESANQLPL